MYNYNKVTLVGRVSREVEYRTTANGVPMAQFRMMVKKRLRPRAGLETKQDLTTFVRVRAWERIAEDCADNLYDGSPVLVEGELQQDVWDGQDETAGTGLCVKAHNVCFLFSRRREPESEGELE